MSDNMILMTLELDDDMATLAGAAQALGVPVSDIDAGYGVIPVSSRLKRYVVRVDDRSVISSGRAAVHSDPSIVLY